jgi:hypothetical protein
VPTPEALTCVNFQYGITNDVGVTADEIFDEVNNTLKTGLLIATRTIAIETLNETFPQEGRLLRRGKAQQSLWKVFGEDQDSTELHDEFGSVGRSTRHVFDLKDLVVNNEVKSKGRNQGRRRTVYLPSKTDNTDDTGRRLVFYTDEYPVVIPAIVNNPFCRNEPQTECAIVSTTVCVLLEGGDDEAEVRRALLDGFAEAIASGDFEDAIPPEHQLPDL